MKEIERKFLVEEMPDLWQLPTAIDIEQFYLTYSPEIRIRKQSNQEYATFTVKSEGDMVRKEDETTINLIAFENLKKIAKGSIEKTRYYINEGRYTFEIDEYKDLDLMTVEVEFNSIEEAKEFNPPEWFGKEVTEDKRYKNKNLARYGLPEERR